MRQSRRIHSRQGRPEEAAIMLAREGDARHRRRWAGALKRSFAVVVLVAILAPPPAQAGACDDQLGLTIHLTGAYVPAAQGYAQAFVFAVRVNCQGKDELVTVQRSTGNFPVCSADQAVEVVGQLVWNRALVDGHYEINNPSKVVCVAAAQVESKAAAPQPPPAPPPAASPPAPSAPSQAAPPQPRRAEARAVASTVWLGRYQDSRGAGEVSVTLVRGTSTVSGTWRVRTGGGGPLVGTLEGDGRRLQFRMENLAPECPGTFQGVAELSTSTLVGTYGGLDCEGTVTDGRLDLRLQ